MRSAAAALLCGPAEQDLLVFLRTTDTSIDFGVDALPFRHGACRVKVASRSLQFAAGADVTNFEAGLPLCFAHFNDGATRADDLHSVRSP